LLIYDKNIGWICIQDNAEEEEKHEIMAKLSLAQPASSGKNGLAESGIK
jgi:hypothetical protein